MAVPSVVEYCTETCCVEAAESDTVNVSVDVPVLPSLTRPLDTLKVGTGGVTGGTTGGVTGGTTGGVTGGTTGGVTAVSSSTMVPVAVALVSVALIGLLSFS